MISCTNSEKQIGLAITLYTGDNGDYYPVHKGNEHSDDGFASNLRSTSSPSFDDRPHMSPYFSDDMSCPFLPRLTYYESKASRIRTNYLIWAGFTIGDGATTMRIVGQTNAFNGEESDIIASETNTIYFNSFSMANHPGTSDVVSLFLADNTTVCQTNFRTNGTHIRGPLDLNYCRADGSVFRLNAIDPDDPRMTKVNYKYTNGGHSLNSRWEQLPALGF
jgi:hypothetical protein